MPKKESTALWILPILLSGLFHLLCLPWGGDLACKNDGNFYLGGAASFSRGLGYRLEPYLDLPSVSQYPPLHSAWLSLFWKFGGGFPGNLPWLLASTELISLLMLAAFAWCIRREGLPLRWGFPLILLLGTSSVTYSLTVMLFSDLTFALLGMALFLWAGGMNGRSKHSTGWWFVSGVILALLLLCRSAGLAFVVGTGLLWMYQFRTHGWRAGVAWVLPVLAAFAIKKLCAGPTGNYSDYFHSRIIELGGVRSYLAFVAASIIDHLSGRFWIEGFLNVPSRIEYASFIAGTPLAGLVRVGIGVAGSFLSLLMVLGIWSQWHRGMMRATLGVLLVYFALILAWPYPLGTRCLLPLAPLYVVLIWHGLQVLPIPGSQARIAGRGMLGLMVLNIAGNTALTYKQSAASRIIWAEELQDMRFAATWLQYRVKPGEWVSATRDVPLLHLRHYFGQRLLAAPTPAQHPGWYYDVPPSTQGNRTATYAVVAFPSRLAFDDYDLRIEQPLKHFALCRVIPRRP